MRLLLVTAVASAILVSRADAAFTQYEAIDLGALPGHNASVAYGISQNSIYIAGSSQGQRAFRWQAPGPMQDLGLLPGANFASGNGVNNAGQVVGASGNHAFIYSNFGPMQDLQTLGGQTSSAHGINSLAQPTVVGQSQDVGGNRRAFWWRQTQAPNMQSLGVLAGDNLSDALAVNDQNQIVGISSVIGGNQHAFIWTQLNGMQALAPLAGGNNSSAQAISSTGFSTGGSNSAAAGTHAVLWRPDGTVIDCGVLAGDNTSAGHGVNAAAVVVGWSIGAAAHPFIWSQAEGMVALNDLIATPGWNMLDATAINNQGWIIGDGLFNGADHAVLLKPIPEPATLGPLALIVGAVARRRRR